MSPLLSRSDDIQERQMERISSFLQSPWNPSLPCCIIFQIMSYCGVVTMKGNTFFPTLVAAVFLTSPYRFFPTVCYCCFFYRVKAKKFSPFVGLFFWRFSRNSQTCKQENCAIKQCRRADENFALSFVWSAIYLRGKNAPRVVAFTCVSVSATNNVFWLFLFRSFVNTAAEKK